MDKPEQANYEDYNQFVEDLVSWQAEQTLGNSATVSREAVRDGVKEALRPPEPPPYFANPEIRQEIEKESKRFVRDKDIEMLGEPELDSSPLWENPYVQKDFEKKISEWNQDNPDHRLVLRKETEGERAGIIKPSNMVVYNLTKDQFDEFHRIKDNYGGDENQKALRALDAIGIKPEHGYPSYTNLKAYEETLKKRDRESSQKSFIKWRRTQGAKPW